MQKSFGGYIQHCLPIAALTLSAACANPGAAPAPATPERGLRSLIAAERAFARHSERAGVKESFMANLGADGILFRPGPVTGLAWFSDRPASPGYLSWEPAVAVLSASGEMGYTTGPWEFRARTVDDTVSGAGHYVTVWRRDSTGTWKIAIDIGTSHAWVPRPADAQGSVLSAPATSLGDSAPTRPRLLARDSVLGVTGSPQNVALLGAMSDDVRLHREGALPTLGIMSVRAALQEDNRPYYSTPLGSAVSRAGDFGYVYGSYELVATFRKAAERGFYLRIWRGEGGGRWRILLDLAQPARPAG